MLEILIVAPPSPSLSVSVNISDPDEVEAMELSLLLRLNDRTCQRGKKRMCKCTPFTLIKIRFVDHNKPRIVSHKCFAIAVVFLQ